MGQLFNCDYQDPHASTMITCPCCVDKNTNNDKDEIKKEQSNNTTLRGEDSIPKNEDNNINDQPKPTPGENKMFHLSIAQNQSEIINKEPITFNPKKTTEIKDDNNNS